MKMILIIIFYIFIAVMTFVVESGNSSSVRIAISVFWPILVCMYFVYVIFGLLVLIFCNFLWRLVLGSWELIETVPTIFAEIFNEYKYEREE